MQTAGATHTDRNLLYRSNAPTGSSRQSRSNGYPTQQTVLRMIAWKNDLEDRVMPSR
jgi:hypothetical protein